MRIPVVFLLILIFTGCSSNQYILEELPKSEPVEELTEESRTINSTSCEAALTRDQLKAQKEITFSFPETCDSVKIYIPSGGSVTGAYLYTDSTTQNTIAETAVFTIGEKGTITLASTLKGRFFLDYGSCNWSSNMWITLK